MMNSLAPKHQLRISVCTEKNMKKKNNTEWTLNQNMHYTEKIQGKAIYIKEVFFSWNEVGNILQLWRIQNDWQDQTCVTKHGSPDARFKNVSWKTRVFNRESTIKKLR